MARRSMLTSVAQITSISHNCCRILQRRVSEPGPSCTPRIPEPVPRGTPIVAPSRRLSAPEVDKDLQSCGRHLVAQRRCCWRHFAGRWSSLSGPRTTPTLVSTICCWPGEFCEKSVSAIQMQANKKSLRRREPAAAPAVSVSLACLPAPACRQWGPTFCETKTCKYPTL